MVTANAITGLPRPNIEGEIVEAISSVPTAKLTERPRNQDSLLKEVMRLPFDCFVDEELDPIFLFRKSWIPLELLRYFIIVPPCEFVKDVLCPCPELFSTTGIRGCLERGQKRTLPEGCKGPYEKN